MAAASNKLPIGRVGILVRGKGSLSESPGYPLYPEKTPLGDGGLFGVSLGRFFGMPLLSLLRHLVARAAGIVVKIAVFVFFSKIIRKNLTKL